MVKRIPVGAHYGLRDWLVQRVTAVVMAVYAVVLFLVLLTQRPSGFEAWKALFACQWMRLATLLFLLSLFWHAWVGMRDILMDYVHATGARLVLQVGVILLLVAYGLWSIQILWSIN
ncbi:MAG: succinate dehydrogenase, hydrophobic membrane anchor protein [Betaproteobacteria bacterium]|nr:succinate dehydrogenase, hydrophobic membrane anchor protein [Betaproteobacteria bacterium]